MMLKSSESGIIDAQELVEMRQSMSEDEFEAEMECSWFAAVKGSYYGQEMKNAKVGNFSSVPGVPSHYAFDLGYTDSTAIWRWQEFEDHLLISLAVEYAGQSMDFYIQWLHAQCEAGYIMGDVWLPHDAKAKTLQTGRSIVEQCLNNGIRPKLVPELSIQDGIQAVRLMFKDFVFDEAGCYPGLKALKSYTREFDEEKKAFRDRPRHDWASNFADSLRYLALVARKRKPAPLIQIQKPFAIPLHYGFTMDQCWDTLKSQNRRLP